MAELVLVLRGRVGEPILRVRQRVSIHTRNTFF